MGAYLQVINTTNLMKQFLTFTALLILNCAFSQYSKQSTEEHLQNRKGKLFLKSELEYRLTPIADFGPSFNGLRGFRERDAQLSGMAIGYTLNYFVTKNLSLNFGQSFRQEVSTYVVDFTTNTTATTGRKSIFIDYHFSLDYYFPVNKDTDFFLRVGLSNLNRGSDYSVTKYYPVGNYWGTGVYNSNLDAINYAIGYRKKRIDLTLGLYSAKESEYSPEPDNIKVIYCKLSYSLHKL